MHRALVLTLCSSVALAANYSSGEVMVVEDTTGAQHDPEQQSFLLGLGTTLCEFASKGLYTKYGDLYDGVMMFTTHPMNTQELGIQNTMRGNIVRQTTTGIADGAFANLPGAGPADYGSPAKLSQCVYMGSLQQLPANPDDQATTLFGGFFPLGMGITGAELMGHEYGHHWLVWASYDKNDGLGKRYLLRGDNATETTDPYQPNGHYNHYSDARSVMYGSFVTPKGGAAYELAGGVRKYNHFDQYFMGLRDASEVSPMTIVDDGSGRGAAVQPLWRGSTLMMNGAAFTVDVEDVIRAIGARNPSAANAQKCFRVAFVLVAHQGHTATAAEIAKVDAWRRRWETWFDFATDGRGHMDATLTGGPGCVVPPTDGGVVVVEPDAGVDAGRPVIDAGVVEVDAGIAEPDAGQPVVPDGGPPPQPTIPQPGKWETKVDDETGKIRPGGCGCQAGGESLLAAIGLVGLALRSRRRPR